ncbi:ABC transporter permease [Caldicellulosiruptoraceae bacterium PP1]
MKMVSNLSVSNSSMVNYKKPKNKFSTLKNNKTLLLMCLPAIIFFFVFSYIPMPGLYIAFVDYRYDLGIFKSPFVGLSNFKFLIMSGDLLRLTRNTILYNLVFIIFGSLFQILVAILLNEINAKRFRKVTQTIMIFPNFISYVLVGLLAYNFLNFDYGVINNILKSLKITPINFYSTPSLWPFIIVITNIWKGAGYGSVIYFATITNIDTEIIEAALIDGANTLQKIRYVILPLLKPTFVILLLFSLGGILRGDFGLFYNLVGSNNSLLFENTDIIETFVFRSLMNNFNFSLGSAVSFYQSILGFFIVTFANWLVKRIEPEYALF